MLTPGAMSAAPPIFERNAKQRLERLSATLSDTAGQRRRPTRPKMRALIAAPAGRLHWREVPTPSDPGPEGAIVHPIASSTCDLDCPLVLGATQLPLPLHLGHECVAEVLSVGERVSTVKPGDRVIVPFQINCGACSACLQERTANCTSVPPISMYGMGFAAGHWGGAFSDQLAVPYADAMLVALPEDIDPIAAASLADNVCDAYRHIAPHLPALLQTDSEAEVLIIAALSSRSLFTASCPLYAALIARAYGAQNITLVDSRSYVRLQAERLGFRAISTRELRDHHGAPLVIHISGDPLWRALSHTAPDGICTSSGGLHSSARIPFLKMYMRNATLHIGRTHTRALIPQVLELIREGRLHPESVITNVAALDDAPRALREHFHEQGIKTVLTA